MKLMLLLVFLVLFTLLASYAVAVTMGDVFAVFMNLGQTTPSPHDFDGDGTVTVLDAFMALGLIAFGSSPVAPPGGGNFNCRSSEPTTITLESYSMPYNIATCGAYGSSNCAQWGGTDSGGNPLGIIVLQNATGGDIVLTGAAATGYYHEFDGVCDNRKSFIPLFINNMLFAALNTNNVSVSSGANITIEKAALELSRFGPGMPCNVDDYTWPGTHTFSISYDDQFGSPNTLTVTCQNFPAT